MQANQLTITSHTVAQMNVVRGAGSLWTRLGIWLTRVLGCWHTEMSRPVSIQGQTYRTCLDCGAQRQFNTRNWEMQGDFYYRRANLNLYAR
ncbi:MAG: hypothetical protein QOD75_432 [Blastocatellia bacterium]|jgi:hypothetical protein|nr:hypothetical protein [Blastocatellia bacterium]